MAFQTVSHIVCKGSILNPIQMPLRHLGGAISTGLMASETGGPSFVVRRNVRGARPKEHYRHNHDGNHCHNRKNDEFPLHVTPPVTRVTSPILILVTNGYCASALL